MNDLYYTVIVILISFIVFLILYVFSSFNYAISFDTLNLKWKILKHIQFISRVIKIENIDEVRLFRLRDDLSGGYVFGNIPSKKAVIIILKKRSLFTKKILITPDKPEEFIGNVKRKMG